MAHLQNLGVCILKPDAARQLFLNILLCTQISKLLAVNPCLYLAAHAIHICHNRGALLLIELDFQLHRHLDSDQPHLAVCILSDRDFLVPCLVHHIGNHAFPAVLAFYSSIKWYHRLIPVHSARSILPVHNKQAQLPGDSQLLIHWAEADAANLRIFPQRSANVRHPGWQTRLLMNAQQIPFLDNGFQKFQTLLAVFKLFKL